MAAAVTVLATGAVPGTGAVPDAGAAAATVVPPGTVASIADPGVALALPADGRLNGYRFTGRVLGVATGTALRTPTGVEAAAAGQRLWVVQLEWASVAAADTSLPDVAAALVVDGQRIPFPTTGDGSPSYAPAGTTVDTGPTWWLASAPAGAADVAVELSAGGYAQRFSLDTMTREAPAPAALYRDPTGWQDDQPQTAEQTVTLDNPADPTTDSSLTITLADATLSWFGPDHPSDTPADPGQAWLIPTLTSDDQAVGDSASTCFDHSPPPADITLTVAGAAPVAASAFPGIGADQGHDNGLFTDGYAFKVPADLTAATLRVTPNLLARPGCQPDDAAMTAAGPATFTLSFPTQAWTAPPGAATRPAVLPAATGRTAPSISESGQRRTGDSTELFAVLIAVAVVPIAALIGVLRHRRRPATDTSPGGPDAPAGTVPTDGNPGPAAVPAEPLPSTVPADAATPRTRVPGPADAAQPGPVDQPLATDDSSPPPTKTPVPADPGPPPDGTLRVRAIGRPDIEGLTGPAPGQTVAEILFLLALEPGRSLSTEQIRYRLEVGRDKAVEPATVRRYINELRRIVGADRLPQATAGGSYQLSGVDSDVAAFTAAIERAERADDPAERTGQYIEALRWVRAAPFAEAPRGAFAWADDSDLSRTVARQALDAARHVAGHAQAVGDLALAGWAAERGLRILPGDEELRRIADSTSSTSTTSPGT